jgi:hypothetical protein
MKGTDKVTTKAKAKATKKTVKAGRLGGLSASAAPLVQNEERVRRGQGETVALTVRLPKDAWMKLRMFAMSQGETFQTLAVSGFNRELAAKGEPPLDV